MASDVFGQSWTAGWVKSSDNPVLSLSENGFDSQNIMSPAIAKMDGVYYLYYSGGSKADFTEYQLGLATSTDGVHFTKTGAPLLGLGTYDNFHVTPALLRSEDGNLLCDADGTWHMIYCGNRADDVYHATSTNGTNWTKDSHGVIFEGAYSPSLLKVGNEYRMYYISKPADGSTWGSSFSHRFRPLLTSRARRSSVNHFPKLGRRQSLLSLCF